MNNINNCSYIKYYVNHEVLFLNEVYLNYRTGNICMGYIYIKINNKTKSIKIKKKKYKELI